PEHLRKITPGPYRATKLWNEIVQQFRDGMVCRRHRRHLKLYSACFPANDSVDFLHNLLQNNPNIGSDVTRVQTLQLLRKFLKNHIIEDVHGKWGSENLADDNHLYRFSSEHTMSLNKQPLSTENKSNILESSESSSSMTPSPPLRTLNPRYPKCNVKPKILTEREIDQIWKDVTIHQIKKSMKLKSLDNLIMQHNINGGWIKHNATKIGKSGVVQVAIEQDLPYWALSAMTCLANWPNGKDTGLPCYSGFEHDVFKAICDFYCHGGNQSKPSTETSEPLLTYDLYELFTNILCLVRPETKEVAVETLQLCLMLLPPSNRRKLHLLLRLMAKVSTNPHLTHINKNMPTRVLLLHTFSRHILACFEEVYLDELLALKLVNFLIDHHKEVMQVPSALVNKVEEKLERMRKPTIRF
uniref:DEP domain-containing protein n=1 Tax=Ciona savignyi TaxID=51511 RepID=H2Z936_CIOSA